jgi:hypothetical protein
LYILSADNSKEATLAHARLDGNAGDATLEIVRAYHQAWTSKNFRGAIRLLSPALVVEVPINEYSTKDSFSAALEGFGELVTSIDLLALMSSGDEAMLLYDLQVERLGPLRVVEHFTVSDGQITRVRQIHDTAPGRAAGLGT